MLLLRPVLLQHQTIFLQAQALVPDQRTALDTHFGAIATDLLRELGGRLWRVREACCLALADLFQVGWLLLKLVLFA